MKLTGITVRFKQRREIMRQVILEIKDLKKYFPLIAWQKHSKSGRRREHEDV